MNISKRRFVLAGILSLSLVGAACSSDEAANDATTAASDTSSASTEPGMNLEGGEVFVTGSSTVEPISVLVSELADTMTDGDLAVTVEGPGTGDGFKKFCAGEADISDASRKIKDEEAATCAEAGIEYVEIEIGIDGLTVATSPNNDAITCLDYPALYALVGPESEGFTSWSDASALAAELGSTSVLPDADLTITGPGPESGTYDSFVELVIKKIAGERDKDVTARTDYTQSPNDNVIVEGIEGSDTSLGWVGFAYYEAEAARMKAIEIDKGDGCIAPTAETIADGTYPLSRSLFIYVSKQALADNPAVGSFVDLFLSDAGIAAVTEAGYVAIPADRLASSRSTWEAARV